MSSSRHPIALRIERRLNGGRPDGATRLLATVMALPLIDGIFPALVLAGALSDPVGVLELGLLVFGGSATVAVVLAEMDGSPRERSRAVLGVGLPLIALAVVETALAPTIASVLNLAVFERFAAVVLLAVAAATASARIEEFLPRPAVIVGFGVLASIQPTGARLVTTLDPGLLLRGGAAAGVGVVFALVVAQAGPWLQGMVDLDRFRFGSAVALGVLALSVLGLVPTDAPLALAVLGVTALLAFDPEGARDRIEAESAGEAGGGDESTERSGSAADYLGVEGMASLPALGDVRDRDGTDDERSGIDRGANATREEEERVPWL